MKVLAAVVLALALSAVAATSTAASGLHGLVLLDPAYPVCRVNEPGTRPAPNVWLVFRRGGRAVERKQTRQDGSYRIALKPDTYGVSTPGRDFRPSLESAPLGGARRALQRVVFRLDTGRQ